MVDNVENGYYRCFFTGGEYRVGFKKDGVSVGPVTTYNADGTVIWRHNYDDDKE